MVHDFSKKRVSICKYILAFFTFIFVLQIGILNIHAAPDYNAGQAPDILTNPEAVKLREELSSKGNLVTQYKHEDTVDDLQENGKIKTILWANGVTPPIMGGTKSEFKKEVTTSGGEKYVEYVSPYMAGNGWYDVNKSEDKKDDLNLCFVAVASNTLHWWFDQNSSNIDELLKKYPDYPKQQEIKDMRKSFNNQLDSGIFKHYLKQYANKKEGYWPDILQDQYINGYRPKPNGGTNDQDFDGDDLLANGPDSRGGFFFNVFKTRQLTERRYYHYGYSEISNGLKYFLMNGNIVSLTYSTGGSSHVVTIWGAEYDLNGKVCAVYFTDSDDNHKRGMSRSKIINNGGSALFTTHVGNRGSLVINLGMLSPGKEIWDLYLGNSKRRLEVTWKDTVLAYNGVAQKPSVVPKNVERGDDVKLTVNGEMVNAGEHTATLTISGADAHKYDLPTNSSTRFTINKIPATVNISVDTADYQQSNYVTLNADVFGINSEKPNGTVTFKYENGTVQSGVNVVNGKASYKWQSPPPGNHRVSAEFVPADDSVSKNYTLSSSYSLDVNFNKIEQAPISIKPIQNKKYGDESFKLEILGGSGNGNVVFSSNNEDIISINGDVATIVGAGTATITAIKYGDDTFNSATATYKVDVKKAAAPKIEFPTASDIIYGQRLIDSSLTGGSTKFGSFAWENGQAVPNVGNQNYKVIFAPNAHTEKNYEKITQVSKAINVNVSKVNPAVILNSEIIRDTNSVKVVLSARVNSVGHGKEATGTIRFVNVSDNSNVGGSGSIALNKGKASFTWTGMDEKLYNVKAIYSGDNNYNSTSSPEITVDVRKKSQKDFGIVSVGSKVYGDKPFNLGTKGGNGTGGVKYTSSNPKIVSISGNTATIHSSGNVTITAVKSGDNEYNEASSSTSIMVNKKELSVMADDKLGVEKGGSMPKFTYSVNGLVNNDKIIKEPNISSHVKDTNRVGEYPITIDGGLFTNHDSYKITYVNGKLRIVDTNIPEPPPEPPVDNNSNNGGAGTNKPTKPTTKPSHEGDNNSVGNGTAGNGIAAKPNHSNNYTNGELNQLGGTTEQTVVEIPYACDLTTTAKSTTKQTVDEKQPIVDKQTNAGASTTTKVVIGIIAVIAVSAVGYFGAIYFKRRK